MRSRWIALATWVLVLAPAPSHSQDACTHDRSALLALEYDRFDQDMFGGWRQLGFKMECELVAADLILAYRQTNTAKLTPNNHKILNWHEGQLRASSGQTEEAIALFERSNDPTETPWNEYARATIAFLRGDRSGLLTSRARLSLAAKPDWFEQSRRQFREKFGGDLHWPPNLDVVDGLIRCFGRPYREAYYSDTCRPPKDPPVWRRDAIPQKQ